MAAHVRRTVRSLTLWIAASAAPGVAAVQEADEAEEAPVVTRSAADVVAAMESRQRLRVAWDNGRLHEGRLITASARAGALGLLSDDRSVEIPYSRIDSLWTEQTQSPRGAAIGGLVGAATGAVVTWGINSLICDAPDGCSSAPARTWALMIGGGAAGGAAIGSLVGAESEYWEMVFPRSGR